MLMACFCGSQDGKSKSIESMKGKINATEGRMENLEDELSRKTGEAKLLQVMQIIQGVKGCLHKYQKILNIKKRN